MKDSFIQEEKLVIPYGGKDSIRSRLKKFKKERDLE